MDSPRDIAEEWVLWRSAGSTVSPQNLFGVSKSPFTVGGGPTDNLVFEGWPAGAVTFWRVGGGISLEAGASLTVDGEAVASGQIVRCRSGTQIDVGPDRLNVLVGPRQDGLASTVADEESVERAGPTFIRLAFLPRGARLYLTDDQGRTSRVPAGTPSGTCSAVARTAGPLCGRRAPARRPRAGAALAPADQDDQRHSRARSSGAKEPAGSGTRRGRTHRAGLRRRKHSVCYCSRHLGRGGVSRSSLAPLAARQLPCRLRRV